MSGTASIGNRVADQMPAAIKTKAASSTTARFRTESSMLRSTMPAFVLLWYRAARRAAAEREQFNHPKIVRHARHPVAREQAVRDFDPPVADPARRNRRANNVLPALDINKIALHSMDHGQGRNNN